MLLVYHLCALDDGYFRILIKSSMSDFLLAGCLESNEVSPQQGGP